MKVLRIPVDDLAGRIRVVDDKGLHIAHRFIGYDGAYETDRWGHTMQLDYEGKYGLVVEIVIDDCEIEEREEPSDD